MSSLLHNVELALLGFLRPEPLHGYEVYQRLSADDGLWQVWRIKQSRLYAMLDRLQNAGYISVSVVPQHNRPARRMLALTALGEQAFLTWIRSPVQHGRLFRLDFLSKLYFAWLEGPMAVDYLVKQQQSACRRWLEVETRRLSDQDDPNSFSGSVRRFRIGQIEAMMSWLDDLSVIVAT